MFGIGCLIFAAGMWFGSWLTKEATVADAHMRGYWQGREDESVLKEWTDE